MQPVVCAFFQATQENPVPIRPVGGFGTAMFIHPGVEASSRRWRPGAAERRWGSAGDQTLSEGVAHKLCPVPHARLGEQVVDVRFHR